MVIIGVRFLTLSLEKFVALFSFRVELRLKFLDLEGLPFLKEHFNCLADPSFQNPSVLMKSCKGEILWNNRFIKIGGKTFF